MNHKRNPGARHLLGAEHLRPVVRFLATCCLLLAASTVLAQSGGGYDLSWSTVDSGGYTSSIGGDYSLAGTAGQVDAGLMSGGTYTLAGGFWPGGPYWQRVYLPIVMRSH